MEQWPLALPQSPLLDGFQDTPQDSVLRSKFDGFTKQRNRFTATLSDVSEKYYMTREQYAVFKSWFKSNLGNGALDFLKLDPETGVNQIYRFTEPYDSEFLGHAYYVTITLEKLP